MSKFYIEGEQTMDEMTHIDYEAVKCGKGNVPKVCPMKFALNNCKDYSCSQQSCAWYCTYPNGEGECAIHSLPGLFDGLDNIDNTLRQIANN